MKKGKIDTLCQLSWTSLVISVLVLVLAGCSTKSSTAFLEPAKPTILTASPTLRSPTKPPEIHTETVQPTTTAGGINLSVDGERYQPGDVVKIVLNNQSGDPIWYEGGEKFWYLQRQVDEHDWIEAPISNMILNQKTNQFECILILSEPETPQELPAGDSLVSELGLEEMCEWPLSSIGYPEAEPALLEPEIYRFSSRYALDEVNPMTEEVNSEPFVIED